MSTPIPPVVRIVVKDGGYSGLKIESTGGAELFRLNATTGGVPGVIVDSDLPKVYRITLGSEDRYRKGMHEARVHCVGTYRDWIKDHLGLDVVVQLTDESGQVLWCSHCENPHPPAIVLELEDMEGGT